MKKTIKVGLSVVFLILMISTTMWPIDPFDTLGRLKVPVKTFIVAFVVQNLFFTFRKE